MKKMLAVGGATGCFAHGVAAAADSGKGERVIVGIILMPLCAMLASSNPAQIHPGAFYPRPYKGMPKRGMLVSRK